MILLQTKKTTPILIITSFFSLVLSPYTSAFTGESGSMETITVKGQKPGEWTNEILNAEFRRFEQQWQQAFTQLQQLQNDVAILHEEFENSMEDESETENRQQCEDKSNYIRQVCEQGPLDTYHNTIENCTAVDWSTTTSVEVDFRLIFSANGSATATVRNYDQCKDVAEAKKDAWLNNCDINDAIRILRCPAD